VSKASEAALSELHATLATVLKDAVVKVDPETGLPNAAVLSVARQFLKDNHIEAGPGAAAGPLQGLAGLPVFEDPNVIPIAQRK
jgi:hypothetical protein